jgi:hypothetical protein
LFRGALLFILWQKLGTARAILISSVSFGIYHWFAWQAFGNPIQMLIIFFTTATVGYILAVAFVRTKSIVLPATLHLGSNIATILLFSKDTTIGSQLLVKSFSNDPAAPHDLIGLVFLILHFTGYQLFTFLVLNWYLNRNYSVKEIVSI